jgi:hypothetical protein
MSAECFARSATMQAPFLYRPADVSREVGVAIDAANAHQFARALKSRAISNKLRGLIEQQMVKQIALVGKLAKTDPGLARVYGEICAEQFRGTEAAKRIKAVMPDARFKEIRRVWHEKFDQIFTGKGIKLGPGAPEFLRAIVKESGEQSTLARMAKLYLAFEEDASSDQPRRRRR